MTMQTYDAAGNPVGPDSVFCANCGQHIKNITYFRGKPYGPECIKYMTGEALENWVVRHGHIDEEATARRKADREAQQAAYDAAAAKARADRQARWESRKWLVDAIWPKDQWRELPDEAGFRRWIMPDNAFLMYNRQHDDFSANGWSAFLISRVLNDASFDGWLCDKLADFIAKKEGRRNSKAYTRRYDELMERLEQEGVAA